MEFRDPCTEPVVPFLAASLTLDRVLLVVDDRTTTTVANGVIALLALIGLRSCLSPCLIRRLALRHFSLVVVFRVFELEDETASCYVAKYEERCLFNSSH